MTRSLTELVADLIASGAEPALAALAVVSAYERGCEHVATRVDDMDETCSDMIPERSKNAVRCARRREKIKQNKALAKANDVAKPDSQTVSPEHVATRVGMSPRCDLSSLPFLENGIREVKEEKKKEVITGARGTRITDDWQPSDAAANFVRELGLDPKTLRDEFVDFWIAVPGSRGLKLDWDRTFKNRARQIAPKGKPYGTPSSNGLSTALRLLKDDIRSADGGEERRGPHPRLLSHG